MNISLIGSRGSIRGDLHFYGKQGMQFYTQIKTITSNWEYKGIKSLTSSTSSTSSTPAAAAPSMSMPTNE